MSIFDLPVSISSLIRIRSVHLLPIFLSATTKQLIEKCGDLILIKLVFLNLPIFYTIVS